MYGHDLSNTRDQINEHTITPLTVHMLKKAWVFRTKSFGDGSVFESTPVVDGGCAFIGSTSGVVYAVNTSNGTLAWKTQLTVSQEGIGGAIVGSPVVSGNEVVVLADEVATGDGTTGPYAIALDRSTGAVIWQSAPYATAAGDYTNASPIVANGFVVAGWSPTEGSNAGQGGFALIDATSGQIVKQTDTISAADQAQGFAGGGLWSTPAFNPATGFLYWGAGNPDSKQLEDVHTNAILKIDLNPSDASFGQIVASYKGNIDQYSQILQQLSQSPICALSNFSSFPYPFDDPLCGQLDLDFGASAQLFKTSLGTPLVGDLQKAGVYHAANANTMAPAWTRLMGISCAFCNAASTAFDGGNIDGVGTPGGVMYSLNRNTGKVHWQSPVLDLIHYEPTSTAGGLVYTIDSNGVFDVWNASTGSAPIRHGTAGDVGTLTNTIASSQGVAVAEHTVFVAVDSTTGDALSLVASEAGTPIPLSGEGAFLVAYRIP
jgi:outer membrane protein assembly factor BamB